MNYLAHLYFADNSDESLIGNLMGDFVKGPLTNTEYSQQITEGIRNHRKVDTYANIHPRVLSSKRRIGPDRRRFAGIIVDVCYDHFLSRHWSTYAGMAWSDFVARAYGALRRYQDILPAKFKSVVPRIVHEDWIGAYRKIDGIGNALDRISMRIRKGHPLRGSVEEVVANYEKLETDFLAFFPELIAHMEP